ncbi:lysophospholipid acyltransferase family protein [Rhodoferax sp. 4810]|uniref:Lysophospholipid acyltransferase family protein n=1 Tax=Thiospirillum jenense TaxID=1653858 RepID=A0A839HD19_9GAMM|nr:lysophospholipid acyltransferase family protein [Thiospirillum jenense]MBB1075466.1 lysophospholipid acyltransferase family protein [Rhodoferax jenense]MBB1126845.1 lysophospholipid acyltransferase family protein [Thiospirillum jenense]
MTSATRTVLLTLKHWPTWLLIGLLRLLVYLPFPILALCGYSIGQVLYFFNRRRRHVALTNIRFCLPELNEKQRRRLIRQHFGYLGQAAVCQGISWYSSRRRLSRIVRIKNRAIIDTYLAQQQPIIVLVPHFIGLELGGTAFTALVHSGMYMYQRLRNPIIDGQVKYGRTRFGSIPIERHAKLRPVLRELKRGTPLFYLPDQDAGKRRGVFVPFCGMPAATVPTLGRLAQLSKARIIPAYARFLPWGMGLELRFGDALLDIPSGDDIADAARMNQLIEAELHTMPAQYFWVHRRFKTRPPGTAAVYSY